MVFPLHLRPGQYSILHKSDGWYWFVFSLTASPGDRFTGGPHGTAAAAFDAMAEYGESLGMEFGEY